MTNRFRKIRTLTVVLSMLLLAVLVGLFFEPRKETFAETVYDEVYEHEFFLDFFSIYDGSIPGVESASLPHLRVPMKVQRALVNYDRIDDTVYKCVEYVGVYDSFSFWVAKNFGKTFDDGYGREWLCRSDNSFVFYYTWVYQGSTDRLEVRLLYLYSSSSWSNSELASADDFLRASEADLAFVDKVLHAVPRFHDDFYLDVSNQGEANVDFLCPVSFVVWDSLYGTRTYVYYLEYGDVPVFDVVLSGEELRYHKVCFKRWQPAITPVSSSTPVTYRAVYENPTMQLSYNGGLRETVTLKFDYIDEDLLFNNFTNEFEHIGSVDSLPSDLIEFENRRDFWFTQYSTSDQLHVIDTNLTLEAVSFRLHKKGSSEYLSFRDLEAVYGWWEVRLNLFGNTFASVVKDHSSSYSDLFRGFFDGALKAFWSLVSGGSDYSDAASLDFVRKFYPESVIQNPTEYELVYMYFYSVDLVESGDDAYLDYADNYPSSVIKLKNNLTNTVTEYPFSYDKDKGCYFYVPMGLYWQSMNKVSSAEAELLKNNGFNTSVFAEISDASYIIRGWSGEVIYDLVAVLDPRKALTTDVLFYTGDFYPDYQSEYTVTIEFFNYIVYQWDRTDNLGSWLDNAFTFIWQFLQYVFYAIVLVFAIWLVVQAVKLIASLFHRRN